MAPGQTQCYQFHQRPSDVKLTKEKVHLCLSLICVCWILYIRLTDVNQLEKSTSTSAILKGTPLFMCESDSYANASNLWAVGWSEVPLQLLVLLQMNKALCLGLLILDLLGDRLQFLWVHLGVQRTHLPHRARDKARVSDAGAAARSGLTLRRVSGPMLT